MTRSRGRPVKPLPVHPERVISRAVKAGLSATVELQRNICNSVTKKHYESSRGTWTINRQVYQLTKERGNPDYSYVLKAEPTIRDNNHKILFENSARYGHTEVKRQKRSDDTVGPINQRLNACGVALREFSQWAFPFPDPVDYGTRTYKVGPNTMKFRVAGYDRSSYGPRVELAHPDLPSLDFGDTVRSHNEYLATFCAIHDISIRETTRYSNLFLLLVRPYLEHIYSEYRVGKSGLQKGLNNALRQVKELIGEAGFRPTMYEDKRVSKDLEFNSPMFGLDFFDKQVMDAEVFYGNEHPLVTELKRLKSGGVKRTYALNDPKDPEEECLTIEDVNYIRQRAVKRTRVAGSIFHRRIADLFPSPWHINDVIFHGDQYSRGSDYVIVSEVSLGTRPSIVKVDLILFERTITEDGKLALWKPNFIIEIKTRKAQKWWIEPVFKKSEIRPFQRVVSEFSMDDHPIDDNMWKSLVNSTPKFSTQTQLNRYTQFLADSFQQSTKRELGEILMGTIIIDSSSELEKIRRVVEQLVIHTFEKMRGRKRRIKRTVFTPNGYDRIALVIHDQPALVGEQIPATAVPWGPIYDPFKVRKDFKRDFILYLSGKTPTSAGQSGAWNARNYHGLQMLYDLRKTKDNTIFLWIDLADQFGDSRLAEARLRLKPRGYSDDEVVKTQPEHIQVFFEKFEIRGFLDEVLSFLYKDGPVPQFVFTNIEGPRVVVVTGADNLRDATPSSHHDRLKIVMDQLLNSLPDDGETTIVWFDSPVLSVDKALPYSSRALFPFYEDNSLTEVVTDIVWNLPVAPIGAVQPEIWKIPIIGDSSMHDDIRVIIRHSSRSLSMELTHIPYLRGWSNRFRNKGRGLVVQDRRLDDVVPKRRVRNRMKLLALTMLPWLVRLWPDEQVSEDSKKSFEDLFVELENEFRRPPLRLAFTRKLLGKKTKSPSILDLLRLRLPDSRNTKSYATVTLGMINSQRLYRSPNKLQTRPLQEIPTSVQTEELEISDDPKPDMVFGVQFKADTDPTLPWWIVVQDPSNEARMLVGCFTHKPLGKDGFLWGETKQETLTQQGLDDILGLSQTIMLGTRTEAGVETWSSRPGEDEASDSGLIEVIGGGRSTVGQLRAIRQTISGVPKTRQVSGTMPVESFYKRVIDSLQRYLDTVTRPIPVTVNLEMVDDECQVTFIDDEESEVFQTTTLEYTADLISLLRWPMTKGGPMLTDSEEYVTWSVYEDIQFRDLDFLKPYVIFKAARSTPEELPKRIAQFFDEAETIPVTIEHDQSVCPIALGEALDHGECWRIVLPHDCPEQVQRQLGRAMTGEEVNGFLAPERLYVGKLYLFAISIPAVSEKDQSVVFHEERYIRMFLRGKGLTLKRLVPGTNLSVIGQKWLVDIALESRSYLKWSAQSTVSGLFFQGGRQIIELSHGRGVEEECERILDVITSEIPQEQVANYSGLEDRVMAGLRNIGYTRFSPPCEFRVIESSSMFFSYGVYPVEGFHREPLVRFTIEATDEVVPDAIVEGVEMSLSEGDLSHFFIRNKESFMRRLMTWVNRNVPVPEDMYEE